MHSSDPDSNIASACANVVIRSHTAVLPIFTPVGNFQIKTASGWTGALESPDFVPARCRELERDTPRFFNYPLLPLGVFGRVLDSALMYEGPRAPDILF